MTALLEVRNLSKHFPVRGRTLAAVSDISLAVAPGEVLGIVGESGCGKSTLGRMMLRLTDSSSGAILFEDQDITKLDGGALRALRSQMQMIFQDPFSSLNPRMKVADIIAEPLVNFGWRSADIAARVEEVLRIVGLPETAAGCFPHAFSGGQRQRIGIARALAPRPRLIICDEAVSALDVSVQAQILRLLRQIQQETGTALVFISHNLGVVRFLSDRIAVLYLGRVVETGPGEELFQNPQHPYTQALMEAIPEAGEERRRRIPVPEGEIPNPINPPPGCPFSSRCKRADARCRVELPVLTFTGGHGVACHYPGQASDSLPTHGASI